MKGKNDGYEQHFVISASALTRAGWFFATGVMAVIGAVGAGAFQSVQQDFGYAEYRMLVSRQEELRHKYDDLSRKTNTCENNIRNLENVLNSHFRWHSPASGGAVTRQ